MENDIEQARASNMENDIEQARASDIEMATNIVEKLDILISKEQYSSESRRSERCIYRVPQPLRKVNWEVYAPQLISIGPLHRKNEKLDNEMRFMSSKENSSEKCMSHCCIYRVPQPLRKVNWEVYALHRGNEKLKAMEKEKLKYYRKLTKRNGMDKKKRYEIVSRIKNQEEHLRYCYKEKFKKIKSNDFVEMILLDAVFIIQFFLESYDDKGPKGRMTFDIREDLILFENQLPLFIIQQIYDRVNPCSQDAKVIPFLDLATSHFRKYSFLQGVETSPGVEKETSPGVKRSRHFTDKLGNLMLCKTSQGVKKETIPDVKKETRHLTDLLRNLMLSRAIPRTYSPDLVKLKYSAIMLRKAGVRFQVTRDECLVNIKFDKGVLKIPHLKVDHNFERPVRNVMALEECLYMGEAYICSYIKFMDQLIDNAGDVGLLVENGIILHWLGDDVAVSKMINNFCKNIGDNDTCFGDISQELNDHYENPWNHRKATLKLVYFPDIWRGTGTVAAAILLILTFIQTLKAFL